MWQSSAGVETIDLEAPQSWPDELMGYLNQHRGLFWEWESGTGKVTGQSYDRVILGLSDVIQRYSIIGWHCTRLTLSEIEKILSDGMVLPNAHMLARRIDDLLNAGLVTDSIARRLKGTNQAHEEYRAGMVWFCFFPPRFAGESGIERFFRHWGGEALYNSHETDPDTAPILSSIGRPSVVEAEVPIANLAPHGGIDFKIVRRFLISTGYRTNEPVDHEDRIVHQLPADKIRRIVSFPDPEFVRLTGCDNWNEPLKR